MYHNQRTIQGRRMQVMKVCDREEVLVQDLWTFRKEQKLIMEGVVYLGRCENKINHLDKNSPIAVIIEHAESALTCLAMLTLSIYDAGDKKALFIEYDNERYGEYPDPASATERRLVYLITKFLADYSTHLTAIGAVLAVSSHDKNNHIFFPDSLDTPKIIERLTKIIRAYCI